MEREIRVAYSKNSEIFDTNIEILNSKEDLYREIDGKKFIDCINYICFISNVGIYIEAEIKQFVHHSYAYKNPGPDLLEYLCEMNFFGREANAKIWYCAFKFSLENKDCVAFWEKYKHTMGGMRFMSLILGNKEKLDDN